MHEPTSILIFRNGSIGNTLVAMPAIKAVRERWPNATLSVVVDPVGNALLEHCPWIDHLIVYDKRGIHQGLWGWLTRVKAMRAVRPSHAILFKRFFRNGLLAMLSGAKVRIGFRTNGRAPFLTQSIAYDENASVMEQNTSLVQLVDAHAKERCVSLFLTAQDRQAAIIRLSEHGPLRNYAVIHYGGLTTDATFMPSARMRELVQHISSEIHCVFVGHGDSEYAMAELLCKGIKKTSTVFNLPLRQTCAIIEDCSLFVGMNSGPAHIAAAAGVNGVVFYKPDSNVEREMTKWKPASSVLKQKIVPDSVDDVVWSVFLRDVLTIVLAPHGKITESPTGK